MKLKRCKNCLTLFKPFNSITPVCCVGCAIDYSKLLNSNKEKKEWRLKKAVMKEKLLSLSDWKKLLEKQINTICRLIDKDCKCISCNAKGNSAGHFHSVQSNDTIRFNLHNLHLQEYNCNGERGGNVLAYARGLIETYGAVYYDYCMFGIVENYPWLKLDKNDIEIAIGIAKESVKELNSADKTYSPELRVNLREHYNLKIGIYNKKLNF